MPTVNSERILNYLKENYGVELTKQAIAEALGVSIPAVTATINALVKKGHIVERMEEIEVEPATETKKAKMKVIRHATLTESGLAYDPVAEATAKAAEKAAEKARKQAEKEEAKAKSQD